MRPQADADGSQEGPRVGCRTAGPFGAGGTCGLPAKLLAHRPVSGSLAGQPICGRTLLVRRWDR